MTPWGADLVERVKKRLAMKLALKAGAVFDEETITIAARAALLAAIEGMGKPSEAILNEGAGVCFEDDERLRDTWLAMLTQAKREIEE